VTDLRLNVERLKKLPACETEQNLLLQTHLRPTAINPTCNSPVGLFRETGSPLIDHLFYDHSIVVLRVLCRIQKR
jgi:hypothetical protein